MGFKVFRSALKLFSSSSPVSLQCHSSMHLTNRRCGSIFKSHVESFKLCLLVTTFSQLHGVQPIRWRKHVILDMISTGHFPANISRLPMGSKCVMTAFSTCSKSFPGSKTIYSVVKRKKLNRVVFLMSWKCHCLIWFFICYNQNFGTKKSYLHNFLLWIFVKIVLQSLSVTTRNMPGCHPIFLDA